MSWESTTHNRAQARTWLAGRRRRTGCDALLPVSGIARRPLRSPMMKTPGSTQWFIRCCLLAILGSTLFLTSCGGASPAPTPSTASGWTWMGGSSQGLGSGGGTESSVYGTEGIAAGTNVPGGRAGSVSWTDNSGNFWLFGGTGYDSLGNTAYFSDLWEFTPSTKMWTWISGSNTSNTVGIYGTMGIAAATNVPGARYASSGWTDSSGNLWLFGGIGPDSTGIVGFLNQVWKFNPTTKLWTWMGGSDLNGYSPNHGGTGPGARSDSVSWKDNNGKFWLFGGVGGDFSGVVGYLNDLWKFDPEYQTWEMMSGNPLSDVKGSYGSLGVAAATSVPGARVAANGWTDTSGNLWLFGGIGYDSTGFQGWLNDLWKFNPTTQTWTWMSGSDLGDSPGSYGTPGVAAVGDTPGTTSWASTWIDSSGNFWLFGGYGAGSVDAGASFDDLWEYNPTTGEWTWVNGTSHDNTVAVYGTQGVCAPANVPGSRSGAASWMDSSGNLWLFGGVDPWANYLNDLWLYH